MDTFRFLDAAISGDVRGIERREEKTKKLKILEWQKPNNDAPFCCCVNVTYSKIDLFRRPLLWPDPRADS